MPYGILLYWKLTPGVSICTCKNQRKSWVLNKCIIRFYVDRSNKTIRTCKEARKWLSYYKIQIQCNSYLAKAQKRWRLYEVSYVWWLIWCPSVFFTCFTNHCGRNNPVTISFHKLVWGCPLQKWKYTAEIKMLHWHSDT